MVFAYADYCGAHTIPGYYAEMLCAWWVCFRLNAAITIVLTSQLLSTTKVTAPPADELRW